MGSKSDFSSLTTTPKTIETFVSSWENLLEYLLKFELGSLKTLVGDLLALISSTRKYSGPKQSYSCCLLHYE